MKLSLKQSTIISFITASLLGVLFHFVYEWSNENIVVALFAPVNESVWEHLKLIFFPIILLSLLEYFSFKIQSPDFICIKLISAIIGMFSTVILFYTYSGIFGKNIDFINIAIYFISMALAYSYSYHRLKQPALFGISSDICLYLFFAITLLFMIFTYYTPNISIFIPPLP